MAPTHISKPVSGLTAALVDDLEEAYLAWRAGVTIVRETYARWCGAPCGEVGIRFAGYVAALDQEELAAASYAAVVKELAQWLER
jgi:hypothetical protein